MVLKSDGLFKLHERTESSDKPLSDALPLDDFVRFVDAVAPIKPPRITKNDAAFAKQLLKKTTLP